jgi:4-hydroxy-3-methylbut-2-enyl diphosphate reductase
VWKRAYTLGKDNFTVVVHGKYNHEETRATYSHSKMNAPTIIVYDLAETKVIGDFILGKISKEKFLELFKGRYTEGFDPETNFLKLGVVNQTTMLATETREISDYLFNIMKEKYGENNIAEHFADTRDTLCYATHDNQSSTYALLETDADIAIVVGGYNSSNTSHIVQLCSKKLKTYFISSEEKIISDKEIMHYDLKSGKEIITENYLPDKDVTKIILTSGASCPDSIVESIMKKILTYYKNVKSIEEVISMCKEDSQTN